MRLNDVNELLKEISETIDILEKEKNEALSNKEKLAVSAPKIKSAHEHLRSAFDYMANDIYELLRKKYAENNRQVEEVDLDRLYFPIRKEPKHFKLAIQKDYRFIDEFCPDIFSLLESIQPFDKKPNWLLEINKDTNANKHKGLSKQDRVEKSHVTVGGEGGVIIIPMSNNMDFTVGSVILQDKEVLTENIKFRDSKIIESKGLPKGSKIEDVVEFHFKGSNSDLINSLKYYHTETTMFKKSLYEMMAKYSTSK